MTRWQNETNGLAWFFFFFFFGQTDNTPLQSCSIQHLKLIWRLIVSIRCWNSFTYFDHYAAFKMEQCWFESNMGRHLKHFTECWGTALLYLFWEHEDIQSLLWSDSWWNVDAILHESHRQRQMLDLWNTLMTKHEKVQETRACNPNINGSFKWYLYVYNS